MTQTRYDVIVVGAGGVGSSAAYHLAQDGRRVLLVEQFQVGHTRGSSHGDSRITRHSHSETAYASLIPTSLQLWRRLEQESGTTLLKLTGSLDIGPPDLPALTGRVAAMQALDFPYRLLSQADARAEFPQFRLPDGWVALHQPGAGILAATRAVRTMAAQAVAHGAELREKTRVLAVAPVPTGVAVELAGRQGEETVHADQAIIAAGPWASRFLDALGLSGPLSLSLRVTHQQVAYFGVQKSAQALYSAERCPVYIWLEEPHIYGFPIWERPGQIKVAQEYSGAGVDPDTHPRRPDEQLLAQLTQSIGNRLAYLDPQPVSAEACLYTHSPDEHFIIDRHPAYPQILISAGFSGRGFKHTIVSGRLLADLAALPVGDYSTPLWRDLFRIDRFAPADQP